MTQILEYYFISFTSSLYTFTLPLFSLLPDGAGKILKTSVQLPKVWITATEKNVLLKTAKYTLFDPKEKKIYWNNINQVLEKISTYKNNWIHHVSKMGKSKSLHAIMK